MSNTNAERVSSRRRSSATQRDDGEDTRSLLLSPTRSQGLGIAESIAVQEVVPEDEEDDPTATTWPPSTKYFILGCAFLTSLSFGVTQVPLLYVFRLMTCDAYYESHQSHSPDFVTDFPASAPASPASLRVLELIANSVGSGSTSSADRCSIRAIESSTALAVSLLGGSTTVFGLLNLFLAGSLIKRIGVKPTLLIQVFFPALRLVVQNIGVEVWGSKGIVIVQCSQIVSILGGPSGYLLALNAFITDVVDHEGRTAALGRLTGCMMGGSALGFLLGGLIAEAFGIKAPFRLTLILFLTASAYVVVFLPHIPPAADRTDATETKRPGRRLLGPLAVFSPRKFVGKDGVVRTEIGAFLLAWGVFLGILATGYLQTMLQLFATDVFSFGTRENGWLIFMYSMLRGIFLTFVFPRIVTVGRAWTIKREQSAREDEAARTESTEQQPLLGTQSSQTSTTETVSSTPQTFTFDLTYTRFSLVADGLLTLLCSFVQKGWQMYLVAAILPFAAGTSSAAKGTILQMVGSSANSDERTDALLGISLVENIARLSTVSVFGMVFAAFASIGRTELVFTCNAAVALVGFTVLLFARFPLEGSHRLEEINSSGSDSEE